MAKIMIGEYEGSIYPDGNGYRGAIDLGFDAKGRRQRVKGRAKTKAQVKDKLKEAVADLEAGVTTDAKYTVEDAVNDFLAKGLKGRSITTIDCYRSLADHNVIPQIGGIKLKQLTADQLDDWLDERAEELSTRTLRLIHQILERAIRQAQARDKVRRNVASLVDVPGGQEGPPIKRDDAQPGRHAPGGRRVRHPPPRRLRGPVPAVRCPHRGSPSPRNGARSTSTLAPWPSTAPCAPEETPRPARAAASWSSPPAPSRHSAPTTSARPPNGSPRGSAGRNTTLSSAAKTAPRSTDGTSGRSSARSPRPPGSARSGRHRELRHSFVSILSAHDVRLEDISDLVGHSSTSVTETVYRHEIRPALTKGATAMNRILEANVTKLA